MKIDFQVFYFLHRHRYITIRFIRFSKASLNYSRLICYIPFHFLLCEKLFLLSNDNLVFLYGCFKSRRGPCIVGCKFEVHHASGGLDCLEGESFTINIED